MRWKRSSISSPSPIPNAQTYVRMKLKRRQNCLSVDEWVDDTKWECVKVLETNGGPSTKCRFKSRMEQIFSKLSHTSSTHVAATEVDINNMWQDSQHLRFSWYIHSSTWKYLSMRNNLSLQDPSLYKVKIITEWSWGRSCWKRINSMCPSYKICHREMNEEEAHKISLWSKVFQFFISIHKDHRECSTDWRKCQLGQWTIPCFTCVK